MLHKILKINNNIKIICLCGKHILLKNYKRHESSRLHQMYLVL